MAFGLVAAIAKPASIVKGPVQSCIVTGSPNVSTSVAIFRDSVNPPALVESILMTSAASDSRIGRYSHLVIRYSLTESGTDVAPTRLAAHRAPGSFS